MPGMKGRWCVWDVEVQNFLNNTWQSPTPSCAVPIKHNISDRDGEVEEDSWKHARPALISSHACSGAEEGVYISVIKTLLSHFVVISS